jgi:hypothetical protein
MSSAPNETSKTIQPTVTALLGKWKRSHRRAGPFRLVDVIGRYSKPRHPEKTLEELQHTLKLATRGDVLAQSPKVQLLQRPIARRLGSQKIAELVAEYESGRTTIQLMGTYQLSKTSVLKLLNANGVEMRRQPPTTDQVEQVVALYNSGKSLAAIERETDIPRESIRRALMDAGIELRQRGGSRPKSPPAL